MIGTIPEMCFAGGESCFGLGLETFDVSIGGEPTSAVTDRLGLTVLGSGPAGSGIACRGGGWTEGGAG